jgi:hypothetical protein
MTADIVAEIRSGADCEVTLVALSLSITVTIYGGLDHGYAMGRFDA